MGKQGTGAKSNRKKAKPELPEQLPEVPWQLKCLRGYRRQQAIFLAENMIAEQREDVDIDAALVKTYSITETVAAAVRKEAWQLILRANESNRTERFKMVLRSLRRLYVAAYDQKKLTVCANIMKQMREMFDLMKPYIEGGGSSSTEEERTTEDLLYFAEHGEYPEETRKTETEKASANPLDALV